MMNKNSQIRNALTGAIVGFIFVALFFTFPHSRLLAAEEGNLTEEELSLVNQQAGDLIFSYVAPSDGLYRLTYECKNRGNFRLYAGNYDLYGPTYCNVTNYTAYSLDLYLYAGEDYSIYYLYGSNAVVNFRNIQFVRIGDGSPDTPFNLIQNGAFNSQDSWTLNGANYEIRGGYNEKGAMKIRTGGTISQTINFPGVGEYTLTFACNQSLDSGEGASMYVKLDGNVIGGNYVVCDNGYSEKEFNFNWQGGSSSILSFEYYTNRALLLDDVSLIYQMPLPLESKLNSGVDCAMCGASSDATQGNIGGGINPQTGSHSQSVFVSSQMVEGQNIGVQLNNASLRSTLYGGSGGGTNLIAVNAAGLATLSPGTIGGDWTHNYEVSLDFSEITAGVSNQVKFKTAGGNQLRFEEQPDGTYSPLVGVTASMIVSGTGYTVTDARQKVYVFNSVGQMTQQVDPSGNVILFDYYTSGADIGKLEQVYQGGREYVYTYNGNGNLASTTDQVGRATLYRYDSNGNLSEIENPEGEVTTYGYDTVHNNFNQITDATGKVVKKVIYNADGLAERTENGVTDVFGEVAYSNSDTRQVADVGTTMTYQYDNRNLLETVTFACPDGSGNCETNKSYELSFRPDLTEDANNNSTTMAWSEDGANLEEVTNALNQTTAMDYDANNNLTTITNARNQTSQMFYENSAHPTFMTRMVDAIGQTSYYTPTAEGLLDSQQGIDGVITSYLYNDYGQPTETRVGVGTSSELVSFYGYDAVGRTITMTQHSPSGAFDDITNLTVYDDVDRVIATIQNWQGAVPANWLADCDQTTTGVRDENICSTVVYDDAGRVFKTTNTLGQSSLSFYDATGRPWLSVSNWDGTPYNPTDPTELCSWDAVNGADPELNLCSTTVYDEYSRVVATRDSLGRWSRTEYDSLGRVAGSIANSVNVTQLSGCSFDPNRSDNDQDLCSVNTYDAVGNLIVTKDAAGRETHMFYDALNRMEGQVTNATGQIASISDFATCFALAQDRDTDLCSQYTFDEVGNTTIMTDPSGQKSRTFYDGLNRVIANVANWDGTLTDPANCVYDANNLNDTNICSKPGYDAATGRQTTSTNALGQTSLTVYDEIGRPFMSVSNWDETTQITTEADCSFPPAEADTNLCSVTYFDDLGRRSGSKDPLGNQTDFTYDDLGGMTTTTRYLQTDSGIVPVVNTTGFDGLGNRKSSTDADGYTVTHFYDGLNRVNQVQTHEGVISTQTYNALGWVTASTNGLGHTTVPTYDGLGRTTSTTNAENEVTQTLYDMFGNQVGMIDANSIRTSYLYDQLNRLAGVIENDVGTIGVASDQSLVTRDQDLLTEFEYNIRGSQVEIMNARGFTVTVTTFDDLERPIAVTNALGDADSTSYDALGNVRTFTDRNGEVVSYTYDGLNRPTAITYQNDGEVVEFEYDALGNRKVMTDGVGVTTYNHDTLYRITDVTDPFNKTVGYEYDLRGNRTKLIYPDSRDVVYEYDGDGRLEKVIDWNLTETTYGYDSASRLITTTLPNGVMAVNVYDDANRLERLTYTDSSGDLIADFDYELDSVGNRIGVIETLAQPGAAQNVTAFLEANGELVLEAESGEKMAGTTHDWVDQTIQSGASSSTYARALPDNGQRMGPTQLSDNPSLGFNINVSTSGDYAVWVRGMGPDPAGDSLHVSVDGNHVGALSGFGMQEWTWSKLNIAGGDVAATLNGLHDLDLHMREDGLRVDKVVLTDDPNNTPVGLGPNESATDTITTNQTSHTVAYAYDKLYRLTDAVYSGGIVASYEYEYDEVGNMQAFTETVDAQTTANTRFFNANNQLKTETQLGVGTKTITYDSNGSMTRIDPVAGNGVPVKLYEYNQRGMMVQAQEIGGAGLQTVAEFRYDGNNDRLEQSSFISGTVSAVTQYTNDTIGLTQVLVSDAGTEEIYQLYGNNLIGQQVDGSSQFQTYITDGLGSVRVEMETSGATNYIRTFSPFGETLHEVGSSSSVYGYTGQQEDESTGLIYLRARYYSAELKAFTAYDVWPGADKRPQSLNHYAYVEGNPILRSDPTGHCFTPVSFVLCFIGALIGSQAVGQHSNHERIEAKQEDPNLVTVSAGGGTLGAGGYVVEGHHLDSGTSATAVCSLVCAGTDNLSPINIDTQIAIGWTDFDNATDALEGVSQSYNLGFGPFAGSYSTTAIPIVSDFCDSGVNFVPNPFLSHMGIEQGFSNTPFNIHQGQHPNILSPYDILYNSRFDPTNQDILATTLYGFSYFPLDESVSLSNLGYSLKKSMSVIPDIGAPTVIYRPPPARPVFTGTSLPVHGNMCHEVCVVVNEYDTDDALTSVILEDANLQWLLNR